LYRDYLADARRALKQIRAAWLEQNVDQFRAQAHYLKGSSQILGATLVAQRSAELEDMGRQAKLANAELLLSATTDAIGALQEELARRLGRAVIPEDGSPV
jgi:HPt (histidine-containing phosphotransfer) domain-containing protein